MANLVLQRSISTSEVSTSTGQLTAVNLTLTLTDTRQYPTLKQVGLTVDWGDGSAKETLVRQNSPYTNSWTHRYKPGSYIIKITGVNYALPVPETLVSTFDVQSQLASAQIPTPEQLGLKPIIYGPILPRDEGYPNQDEWSFQSSQDSLLLESSARMLLITRVGERLMQLDYGTRIPAMIFNPSSQDLQDAVSQEVIRAFNAHEPRVSVSGVIVTGIGSKEITVRINLTSKLDERPFSVFTTFVRS